MPDEIKVNRPQGGPARMESSPSSQDGSSGSSKAPWVILIIVVLVLLVVGALMRDKLFGSKSMTSTSTKSSGTTSAYQAVFLTNGQVYFGKLANPDGDYVTLSDIYYLQVIQPPLQGTPQTSAQQQQAQQPSVSLVKLGNELHGPVDEMHISRSQVLFYEDLKDDGNVVKAIMNYKNGSQGK